MIKTAAKPLIEAAQGRRPARRPVWFMRQAGRYLPEYRAVRATVDFTTMCQTPALAAEVTLQPLRRYDVDAAIIFSDILIPCVGMGQALTLDKGEGPRLSHPVRGSADLARLKKADGQKDMGYVGEAIALTKAKMDPTQTMIGFAGAPFTVASYMIEGAGSKTFTEVKRLLFREPAVFAGLMDLLVDVSISYLKMQVAAGADAVMLFDTWAGQLAAPDYQQHVLPATKRVIGGVRALGVPVTYFPGQGLDRMFELDGMEVDAVSVDWRTRLVNAQRALSTSKINATLQGNLDPQCLIAPEGVVRQRVRDVLDDAAKSGARQHIFNVGHGLLPHTPPEALTWVIDEVRRQG